MDVMKAADIFCPENTGAFFLKKVSLSVKTVVERVNDSTGKYIAPAYRNV
jgi:hypothetical protein